MVKSFKEFLKEEENKHPYISSLEDELGIDTRDLEKEPQIGSFFSMGNITKNVGPYKILKFKRNDDGEITHAIVKNIDDHAIKNRKYKDQEGNLIKIDNEEVKTKTFLVPIQDLDKLMSQDFQPPPAPPGGI